MKTHIHMLTKKQMSSLTVTLIRITPETRQLFPLTRTIKRKANKMHKTHVQV